MSDEAPLIPDYSGACVCNVVPALFGGFTEPPSWFPAAAFSARQVVMLVLDGLGWEQMAHRRSLTPSLHAMTGGPISTVVPTTTATAMTSITTGLSPGQHGVIGYRMAIDDEVLNVLRWSTPKGDARRSIRPTDIQKAAPFHGERPPIVTRADFSGGGFSAAHLDGVRFHGYRTAATMVHEIRTLVRAGEPFVFAYYDGLDKVSHEYGLRDHFDAEIEWCDRLVAEIINLLPPGGVLVITADHGQVHTGDHVVELPASVLEHVAMQSGEARFRWLHARPGRHGALLDAARDALADQAWVRSKGELIDEEWFGPTVTASASKRLGDVALVAKGNVAFEDPADTGPYHLIGRHGSLTEAEVLVPLLVS
jgi:predicted AlkP superfamily pyrophosphatase or phosphodiesterase